MEDRKVARSSSSKHKNGKRFSSLVEDFLAG